MRVGKVDGLSQKQKREETSENLALQEMLDCYLEELRVERNASEHSIRAYRVDLEAFLSWSERASIDPRSATIRDIRRYLGDLDRAQYARTTINRKLSALRGFYRWLTVTNRIAVDPTEAIQGPRQPRNLPTTILPADMARILAVHSVRDEEGVPREQSYEDMRDQALLEFLYACGARVSEAAGLLMNSVDFAQGQVRLFGKGSKERVVPIHDMAIDSMMRYVRMSRAELLKGKESPYFFVSNRGNKMSTDAIRKIFKATLRAAGVDETLSPHDMRHSFASDVLSGGADLRSVQEMLGHTSLSTTQIYTHVSPERLKRAHAQAHPRSGN